MTEPRSQINSWSLPSKGKSKKKGRKKEREKEHLFAFISCTDEVASNTCNYSLLEKGIN